MENFLFLSFSFLTIVCSIAVITTYNPIHCILFLVLVFFNVASLLIFLGVDFLALLFLIVYIGAVAVLFLFIIMMLNVKSPNYKIDIYQYLPISFLLGICFLTELSITLNLEIIPLIVSPFSYISYLNFYLNPCTFWSFEVSRLDNIQIIASVLYTSNLSIFILAGMVLLISMIGAIALTLHKRSDIKRQQIFLQVQQDFNTTISWKTIKKN
jgi:NADH-quinone oxidoreductase subunit J